MFLIFLFIFPLLRFSSCICSPSFTFTFVSFPSFILELLEGSLVFTSYTTHTCYRHRSIRQTYRGTWQQFKYLSNCVCANLICTLFDPSSLSLSQSPAESVKKCELKTGDSHGRSIERVLKKEATGRGRGRALQLFAVDKVSPEVSIYN